MDKKREEYSKTPCMRKYAGYFFDLKFRENLEIILLCCNSRQEGDGSVEDVAKEIERKASIYLAE